MNVIKVFFFFFCTLTPFFTYSSNGGISLSQTRVIFSSNKDSASIYVKNTSSNDVWLLRGWVTSFESDEKDDSFVITPPLYRLDPERNIQLRINVTDKNKFPKDVESVYYLNVMAIPPQMEKDPSARENTNISFSINNRIKLFHRPESINNRKLLAESYKKITVQQRGGHVVLSNSSPYYITLDNMQINKKNVQNNSQDLMIPPKGEITIPFAGTADVIDYQVIDDFGGKTEKIQIKI